MNAAFLQARITATQAQIVAYEDAILALVNNGVQEYLLDTGQTRQRVQKLDLRWMQANLDTLYNRCSVLEARANGSGVLIGIPAQ